MPSKEKFPAEHSPHIEGGGLAFEHLKAYAKTLREAGFSDKEVDRALRSNEDYRYRADIVDEEQAKGIFRTLAKRHPEWTDKQKDEMWEGVRAQLRDIRLAGTEGDEDDET